MWVVLGVFYKKLKNVSCEYDRVNGWNSTLQDAWYIRHVRIIWFLWTKRTILLLILSFTQNIVRACSMFYPYYEGYRSVTPLDAARVNRTVFHNHSVYWYYITLIRVGIILSTIVLRRYRQSSGHTYQPWRYVDQRPAYEIRIMNTGKLLQQSVLCTRYIV